jgi:hypothetical protein
MTNFHSGFAFTDWRNHIKKKVRVVVCVLAEIKTGHLSNTFQTEDNTMISQAWNPQTTVPLHKP